MHCCVIKRIVTPAVQAVIPASSWRRPAACPPVYINPSPLVGEGLIEYIQAAGRRSRSYAETKTEQHPK